ncbi:MAG TPA: glycosyltransferase family 2 protein, partial [Methylomirabilota bacterium]|nr:glycosyltransferase family 2 protein [Methylomirabilota bacterium]
MSRFGFCDAHGATESHDRVDQRARLAFVRREIRLTIAGLVVTLTAAALTIADMLGVLAIRIEAQAWAATIAQGLFFLIVAALIYGACVYQLARIGQLRRHAAHVPATDEDLRRVYREAAPPLLTVLVPSYMEEARVVRRTLLSAALQEYPRRRIVLLIDDPPVPRSGHDAERLATARALPGEIAKLLDEPAKLCAGAFEAFLDRRAMGLREVATEGLALSRLYADVASWFERQADLYDVADHTDQLFVEVTLRGPGQACRAYAERLRASVDAIDEPTLMEEYARLSAWFRPEITAFERKRYDNLSHAPNKAMNLNSYIALLGRSFREVRRGHRLLLEPADSRPADIVVPQSEFLLIVDADSLLTPDYALRLMHVMRTPGNERVAVAQTPYNAFPGARSLVERIAGATTDIQYLTHQGFTQYGATYWVGANAIVRVAALADIGIRDRERGYEITRFIRDDTVIEDTESTVDLIARGWRLYNYPERLAYSETPPDFGALLIQRRRWA